MTLTAVEFLEEFPEFDGISTTLVDAKLTEAYRRTPARVWGDLEDDGAKYLTAHLLAFTPFAAELKLVGKERETIYGDERKRLERIVSAGFRVTGEP